MVWRWLAIIGVSVIAILVIAADSLALHAARTRNLAAATIFRPSAEATKVLAAETLLLAGNASGAKAMAQGALARMPTDVAALRTLALAEEKAGRGDVALALMTLSGRLSWRDTPSQAWLFRKAVLARDFDAMAQRGDALLRRRQLVPAVLSVFRLSLDAPNARAALVSRLQDAPSWRGDLLASLRPGDRGSFVGPASALLDLAKSPAPASETEVAPFMQASVDGGFAREARGLWQTLFRPRLQPLNLILDGAFDELDAGRASTQSVGPFAWRLDANAGADVDVETPPAAATGKALVADYSGDPTVFVAYQTVVAPPGRWRFSVRVQGAETKAASRARILIRCAPVGNRLLEIVSPALDADRWRRLQGEFDVPAGGCDAQLISIGFMPGKGSETLWFDDVIVAPAGNRTAQPIIG